MSVGGYWEDRYRSGRSTGSGSYDRLAMFKARIINRFVADNAVASVVDLGCGDGHQLSLADYPSYTGLDISPTVVEKCRIAFASDTTKRFDVYTPAQPLTDSWSADLALSLDVLYHLSDDAVYDAYLADLFALARKYVVIYANDSLDYPVGVNERSEYVRFRNFTRDVATRFPGWHLVRREANAYPFNPSLTDTTSFADFYFYARNHEVTPQPLAPLSFAERKILAQLQSNAEQTYHLAARLVGESTQLTRERGTASLAELARESAKALREQAKAHEATRAEQRGAQAAIARDMGSFSTRLAKVERDLDRGEAERRELYQIAERIDAALALLPALEGRLRYVQDATKKIYRKQYEDRTQLDAVRTFLLAMPWRRAKDRLRQRFPRIAKVWTLLSVGLAKTRRNPRRGLAAGTSLLLRLLRRPWAAGRTLAEEYARTCESLGAMPLASGAVATRSTGTPATSQESNRQHRAAGALLEQTGETLQQYVQAIAAYCIRHPEQPLVLMNSTAKPMSETAHITYRSTFLAREMLRRGVPVVFGYYNWDKSPPVKAGQALPLIELSADALLAVAPRLAQLGLTNRKLFICGIPDFRSAQLLVTIRQMGFSVVYDVWDDHELFAAIGLAHWYDAPIARYVATHADRVFTVCPGLRDKIIGMDVSPHRVNVLSNGVAAERVVFDLGAALERRRQANVIGYVGNISPHWFDWGALLQLARELPKTTIELIGPHQGAPRRLPTNVRLLGPMDNEVAYRRAQDWRVGIIPHVDNAHIQHADSVKVYEYLAIGLPVVTIHKDFLKSYPLVFTYGGALDIARAVREAMDVSLTPTLTEAHRHFMQAHTWEAIVDEILAGPEVVA
ncbi:MAG: glycosyltransferase [Myxococcota bacterium]